MSALVCRLLLLFTVFSCNQGLRVAGRGPAQVQINPPDKVELFISRQKAYDERLRLIANETEEIRYNTYVFKMDTAGREILGALVNAARRGVKVQLVLDSWEDGIVKDLPLMQGLIDLGIEVRVFNPLGRHPHKLNERNHIKSLIVKSQNAMLVGGRNSQDEYFSQYIDVEARVTGPEVQEATKHYETIFNSPEVKPPTDVSRMSEISNAKQRLLRYADEVKPKLEAIKSKSFSTGRQVEGLRYVADPPNIKDKKKSGINRDILAMIDRAEESIEILNPYVLFSPQEEASLKRALKRGVKIKIVTNAAGTTDSRLFAIAWDLKKHQLEALGMEVYESDRYIHGKTIIRDSKEVFIGSFNMDMRSYFLNLENGVFFKSETLAGQLGDHQRRITSMFTTRVKPKGRTKTTILRKGGECVRQGMRGLISTIVYPIL